ncbi:hypothetical protein FOZ62_018758, partial [Perkinsus olseni]
IGNILLSETGYLPLLRHLSLPLWMVRLIIWLDLLNPDWMVNTGQPPLLRRHSLSIWKVHASLHLSLDDKDIDKQGRGEQPLLPSPSTLSQPSLNEGSQQDPDGPCPSLSPSTIREALDSKKRSLSLSSSPMDEYDDFDLT